MAALKKYGFGKEEKLVSSLEMDQLFKKGKWLNSPNLRLVYHLRVVDEVGLPRVLISAPKRIFKKAVVRNRLKRRMREAYRLNNLETKEVCSRKKVQVLLGILYHGGNELDYNSIETEITSLLGRLIPKINKFSSRA